MTQTIDQARLEAFVGRVVEEVGAAYNTVLVAIGDELGLYDALAANGPLSSEELAARTGSAERYVREWLAAQAASGFLRYHPKSQSYELGPEQAAVLVDETSPVYLVGRFQAAAVLAMAPRLLEGFRTGQGVGWHEHGAGLFEGTERFFRSGYRANLVSAWIPALDGVHAKLGTGIRVADIGCGHGASTILMAQAYPASTFVGYDYHEPSIDAARRRAEEAGVADRVSFDVATAGGYPGTYDFVACFDALHDMGDPVAAARHVLTSLAPDGTWMLVEPRAGDRVEDNLNPIGRLYYAVSTMICTPASLAQDGRMALGAQAGPAGGSDPRRWVHSGDTGHRDPVQHRPGSPAMSVAGDARTIVFSHPTARTRLPLATSLRRNPGQVGFTGQPFGTGAVLTSILRRTAP